MYPFRNATTAACVRSEAESFSRMSRIWPLTVPSPMCSLSAISELPARRRSSEESPFRAALSGETALR